MKQSSFEHTFSWQTIPQFIILFALIVFVVSHSALSQPTIFPYSGTGTGTPLDRWTINDDNSSHTSHLRLQAGDIGYNLYNNGRYLGLSWDVSWNHSNYDPYGNIMTWTNNGLVGIGTDQPMARLHVNGSTLIQEYTVTLRTGSTGSLNNWRGYFGTTSDHALSFGTNESSTLNLATDGRVGIGVLSPVKRLHVIGSILAESNGIRVRSGSLNDGTVLRGYLGTTQNHDLALGTNDTMIIMLSKTGEVGIGTSDPQATLDVDGEVHVSGDLRTRGHVYFHAFEGLNQSGTAYLQARDDSGSSDVEFQFRTQNQGQINEVMRMTKTGDVGIGTTAPQATLDVNGNTKSDGLIINPTATDYGGLVEGTVATINGAVHISPKNSIPRPFSLDYLDYNTDIQEYLLWVEKGVVSEDFAISDPRVWDDTPDYVFEEDYELPAIDELSAYVRQNKHLPGIPGVEELKKRNHYQIHDMLMGQLKNIEELVLHTIEQEAKIKRLNARMDKLEAMIVESNK